ncbi:TetR/AcrR family transcriptional regulator [Nocardia sp. CDC159]|uniref:TetR/AcrR family transcriptional regulator n=1 Tax=Nocardia pulmonis TaxID=2951408 RepID=A0A9X2E1K7_9NOCA|nr:MULTISPECIES: TetR/AcrR family transcriptional regulator [Nocardia]MCM6771905.1 TetR/AcrR family transcriptional regulator [Nocardia pulmonis]MCM6785437.1 TetR/AcrR family transcriptional regulator [Nocardia sp. CDC159]
MTEAVVNALTALVAPDAELVRHLGDGDEVTARIVAAAYEQMAVVGWRRCTMDDVARRARLGRATVYRKFPTRQALLDAVVLAEVRKYLADSTAAVSAQPTVADRIAESAAHTMEFLRGHRVLRRLLETEPESVLPALTTHSGPLLDLVREFCVAVWRRELAGDTPISEEREQHLRTVAELHIRITLSFILGEHTSIPLDTAEQAREFARTYLAPMLLDGRW